MNGKYFATTSRGEIHELRNDLNSTDKEKVKDAVKKVIAAMTVGKDVSALFTDVIKSIETPDIELKKLVYLYIINYARSQPTKAILVVNSFQKDASYPNPLIRALAIRTMGCIRVNRITEYLCIPLANALKDKDPYVRKTAAVCAAKLYDLNPELVEEHKFCDTLRDLLGDPNPTVVANSVAALAEMSEKSGKDLFQLSSGSLSRLLTALNECTEWGQVAILDSLAKFQPSSAEVENVIERVLPRLQHANQAVVMSAVRVILQCLASAKNAALEKKLYVKLAPPLITLLSSPPEIMFVALRNIRLIIKRHPALLSRQARVFFIKYTDPLYVKLEKVEILVLLADEDNYEQLLQEFKEAAAEVDMEFVRRAIRAIGRVAIKLPQAADKCVRALQDLIAQKVNFVVQESIVVMKDIFRKYPGRYEGVIASLCAGLERLDEPEAKAALIWIVGEYAERIDNAVEQLEAFVDGFKQENEQVQHQLLTAVVKTFLKRPEAAQALVKNVLNLATKIADNPDLRDRAYIYWRLLAADPNAAKAVVLATRPPVSEDTTHVDTGAMDVLIANLCLLSSCFHQQPEAFVKGVKNLTFKTSTGDSEGGEGEAPSGEAAHESEDEGEGETADTSEQKDAGTGAGTPAAGDLLGAITSTPTSSPSSSAPSSAPAPAAATSAGTGSLFDLDTLFAASGAVVPSAPAAAPAPAPAPMAAAPSLFPSMLPVTDVKAPDPRAVIPQKVAKLVLPAQKGAGLEATGYVCRQAGELWLELTFYNKTEPAVAIQQIDLAVRDVNGLGIKAASKMMINDPMPIQPGGTVRATQVLSAEAAPVPLAKLQQGRPIGAIDLAARWNNQTCYFGVVVPPWLLFTEDTALDKSEFLNRWKAVAPEEEQRQDVDKPFVTEPDIVLQRLDLNRLFLVARRAIENKVVFYCSCKFRGLVVLVEVSVMAPEIKVAVKAPDAGIARLVALAVSQLLSA